MSHSLPFSIRLATWQVDQPALYAVRHAVFVEEQNVPVNEEIDIHDSNAVHWLALDKQQHPIGTVRLQANGKIGRMAVLVAWRKQGVGSALLRQVVAYAQQQGYPHLFLHAQVQASSFYQRHNFVSQGNTFTEAGILHQTMIFFSVYE